MSEAEREALVGYLGSEPVCGERFTVCLPDGAVPGGNGSIAEAVTPKRFIDYMSGRSDSDGRVYAWGSGMAAADGDGSCDDGDVCGSPHLEAEISGPMSTGGGLEAIRASDGMVTVVNSPPSVEGGASTLVCPADGDAYEPGDLNGWSLEGKEYDKSSPYIYHAHVSQLMIQPPECPHSFPALLYVARGVSDGQLVYSGGWVIDDAALYPASVTALTVEGLAPIVGVECCVDYSGDYLSRLVSDERARRGARLDSGPVDSLVDSGVLSE